MGKKIKYLKVGRMLAKNAVAKYKKTKNRRLLAKIKAAFKPFRGAWAKFLSDNNKEGLKNHDRIIKRCIKNFRPHSAMNKSKNAFTSFVIDNLLNAATAKPNRARQLREINIRQLQAIGRSIRN